MSLFPFLVVLMCTMGALILLLVIIARQARLQGAERASARNAEVRKDLEDAREWAQLEISEYQYSREKTESQLADARLALGHVEDHARQLCQKLARLEATWSELDVLQGEGADRREELEAQIERLRGQTALAEIKVAQARDAAKRRQSYAIVPYEGPHATHRRPIYVECRADAVVLQPEGVVFDADDFAGPLGSGNSLDVALRAVREYLLRHQAFDREKTGEPYPLLLVRPEGIEAYYAARAAMRSWASDFGYELIGDDWQLELPPPDPQLAAEVAQAVATARLRQQRLIAASPSLSGGKSRAGFVVSSHRGGLVPRGGSSDDDASAYKPQRPFGRLGNQYASWDDRHEGRASGPEALGAAPATTEQKQTSPPSGTGERPAGKPRPESRDASDSGLAAASDQPPCLASVRGRNWGLPNAAQGWVPITAPIRVDCLRDRLILVPEKGLGRPRVLLLGPRTEDAVDELVSAVWEYTERWGSAGNGMYWRPVLNLHVGPDAETRYADLKTLLDGSGLGVERK
ncbi:MAG TPA: hypothetical protein VMY37_30175 [Thermoguttaceae bacterium]|nr:hypothetical protein [Thermoguttaceae bacterium]